MVPLKTRIVLGLVALVATAAGPLFADAQRLDFVAAWRQPSEAWLLEKSGRVFLQRGTASPVQQVSFKQKDGSPFRWRRSPAGITRFHGLWVVTDGLEVLRTFSADGRLVAEITLPLPAFTVFATEKRCWIYYSLPNRVEHALFSSTDLRSFSESALNPVDPELTGRDRVLLAHVMFGPAKGESFYFAPFVGEPYATRVDEGSRVTRIPLAYLRTRERAELTRPTNNSDVADYSEPARDLFTSPQGDLFVLRNREDLRGANGVIVRQQARRVDRYGADGRHLGTATLPTTVRWILRGDKDRVWAVTFEGVIQSAPFGAPVRGGIVN